MLFRALPLRSEKSALQLSSFNANNSTSVEQSPNTDAKTIIILINIIRSKNPSPSLCAQTNRSTRLRCFLPRLRRPSPSLSERTYEVCSKSIRPFSLSPIRYEQTARAKRGCTHTHSRVIVKRFRPIRHSYLSV